MANDSGLRNWVGEDVIRFDAFDRVNSFLEHVLRE